MASHLQINNTLTATRTQFINLLIKRVEVYCSFAKLTAILTAKPALLCELERTPTDKNATVLA